MVGRPTREELLEALEPVSRSVWGWVAEQREPRNVPAGMSFNVILVREDVERILDVLNREARYTRGMDNKEKSDFESQCDEVGAHADWYGQEVKGSYGSTYTITDVDPTRPRNKIRGISKNGKLRYFSVDVVAEQLGRGPMAPLRRGRMIDLD